METNLDKSIEVRRLFFLNNTLLFIIIMFFKILLTTVFLSPIFFLPGLLFSLVVLLSLFSFIYLFNKKQAFIYFYIFNLLISSLLVANCLYYSYFTSPLSIYTLLQYQNLSGLGESIVSVFEFKYMVYFIDLIILPFFYRKYILKANKIKFLLFLLPGLIIIVSLFMNFKEDENIIFRRFDSQSLFISYGPIGYHLMDSFFFFKNLNKQLSSEERQKIQVWYENNNKNYNSENLTLSYQGMGKGKNLIIIQVESLQNFVINKKVNNQEITPNINRLLKNSLYFSNIYPQTMQGNSSDAEFLVNTSLFPLQSGSVYFRYPNNVYNSLPIIMKNQGYGSFAIHGDEGSFWNRSLVYPNLGFSNYYDITSFKLDEEIGMGLGDSSMFKQTIDILEKKKKPFYSFIITLTSHMPFELPEKNKILKLNNGGKLSNLDHYLQSIRYTDKSIGEFIQELENRNMLLDSMIVIYGDHDGIFEEDKELVEKWLNKRISNEEWLRHYVNIPLLIYNPSIEGEVKDIIGGQIDILPTVIHIMGIDKNIIKNTAMGSNLLSTREGTTTIPGGGYVKKSSYLTKDKISDLNKQQLETLNISKLIIEGNFFYNKSP